MIKHTDSTGITGMDNWPATATISIQLTPNGDESTFVEKLGHIAGSEQLHA